MRKILICVAASALLVPGLFACSEPAPTAAPEKAAAPSVVKKMTQAEKDELKALNDVITAFAKEYPPNEPLYREGREKQKEVLAGLKVAREKFASKDGKAAYIEAVNTFLLQQIEAEQTSEHLIRFEKAAQGSPSQRLVIIKAVDERRQKLL